MNKALWIVLLLSACGKEEAETPKAEPAFEPGPLKEHRFDSLGVTIQAPDNLKVDQSDQGVTLSAPGFPTVTLTAETQEPMGMGRSFQSGTSRVRSRVDTPDKRYQCLAESPGKHKDLLATICQSMAPKRDPRVLEPKCEGVEGLDAAAVTAAFEKRMPAALKCIVAEGDRDSDLVATSVSISLTRKGNSTSFAHSEGRLSDEAKACLKPVYEDLRGDEALTSDADLTLSCRATLTLY